MYSLIFLFKFGIQLQVHVCDHSEVTEEYTKKFIFDYLARRLMGRRLRKL